MSLWLRDAIVFPSLSCLTDVMFVYLQPLKPHSVRHIQVTLIPRTLPKTRTTNSLLQRKEQMLVIVSAKGLSDINLVLLKVFSLQVIFFLVQVVVFCQMPAKENLDCSTCYINDLRTLAATANLRYLRNMPLSLSVSLSASIFPSHLIKSCHILPIKYRGRKRKIRFRSGVLWEVKMATSEVFVLRFLRHVN